MTRRIGYAYGGDTANQPGDQSGGEDGYSLGLPMPVVGTT